MDRVHRFSKIGLTIIWGLILFFLQGMILVWLNIERIEMSYKIKKQQAELAEKQSLYSKLELEKNNLISPYRLESLAKKFNLQTVHPEQVHKLD